MGIEGVTEKEIVGWETTNKGSIPMIRADFSGPLLTSAQSMYLHYILRFGPAHPGLKSCLDKYSWTNDIIDRLGVYFAGRKFSRRVKANLDAFREVDYPALFLEIEITEPNWRKLDDKVVTQYTVSKTALPKRLLVGVNGHTLDCASVDPDFYDERASLRHILPGLSGEVNFQDEYNFGYVLGGGKELRLLIKEIPDRQFHLQTQERKHPTDPKYFNITETVRDKFIDKMPLMSGG